MNNYERNISQQGETENKVMQDEGFARLLIVSVIENPNHTSEPNIIKQEHELFKSEQKVVTLPVSTSGTYDKFQMQTLDIEEIINLRTHITKIKKHIVS